MTVTLDSQGNLDLSVPTTSNTEPKAFAIIGTRKPDEAQKEVALHLAFAIAVLRGQKVRTGAAYGIDHKAMEGTRGNNLQVYLPWGSYNRDIIPRAATVVVYDPQLHTSWTDSVYRFHPNPPVLSHGAMCLHARNFGIVSGCSGVIALSDETGSGGTAQGIRIAKALGIPIIQGNKGSILDVPRWIGKALQDLGLASKDIPTIIRGKE
jgi:hypothetical protein